MALTLYALLFSGTHYETGFARECKDRKGSKRVYAGMRERIHFIHYQ